MEHRRVEADLGLGLGFRLHRGVAQQIWTGNTGHAVDERRVEWRVLGPVVRQVTRLSVCCTKLEFVEERERRQPVRTREVGVPEELVDVCVDR